MRLKMYLTLEDIREDYPTIEVKRPDEYIPDGYAVSLEWTDRGYAPYKTEFKLAIWRYDGYLDVLFTIQDCREINGAHAAVRRRHYHETLEKINAEEQMLEGQMQGIRHELWRLIAAGVDAGIYAMTAEGGYVLTKKGSMQAYKLGAKIAREFVLTNAVPKT